MIDIGKAGECAACVYLEKKSYSVIATRYFARVGEIDIICTKNGVLTFVEVRSRRSMFDIYPEDSVTQFKRIKLQKAASVFLSRNQYYYENIQFDIIGVVFNLNNTIRSIQHVKNILL